MEKRERRRRRVVAPRDGADEVALARPQLVELSPEQEREAVQLLADLFAQAARRQGSPTLREAA